MRVLVTGFPPFPGRPINPSQQIVDAIRTGDWQTQQAELVAEVVPCEYRGVERAVDALLDTWQPDLMLAFGVGRHSTFLRLESSGVNLDCASIPDNAGELRENCEIIAGGPDTVCVTHDVHQLAAALNAQHIPAEVSRDAGRYVCNHLLYYATTLAIQDAVGFRFQFIHVPGQEQGFELARTLRSIEVMVEWFRG